MAGYKIHYGTTSGSYTTAIALSNPGLTAHFVEGLVPSTYYFVITAYNSKGVESSFSNEAITTI